MINKDKIDKIFNLELKLTDKKDKEKLSKYTEYIPMFDIYSLGVYPIKNINIHTRLSDSHYRFINDEIYNWIKNMLNNNIDNEKKERLKKNLKILDNYILDTLYETSINTFFKYSPKFGLDVSICKRNSFHPLFSHINPYYTRTELIKLGLNMNVIKEVERIELLDKDLHYKICKTVSKNDVDFETIKLHSEIILKNNGISAVNYYSLIGSFIINNILRDNNFNKFNKFNKFNQIDYNYLLKMTNLIKKTPAFEKDYYFYRFLWDDKFIEKLEVGDIFEDKGFISCTRDPFYAPGLEKSFGLILMKINIPKNKKGLCLFIENYSLFKSEEEVILAPNSKLKLISKDDNFKYYHINPKFERLVDKKYEFELVGNDVDKLEKEISRIKIDDTIRLNENVKLNSDIMYNRLKELVNYTKNSCFKIDNNIVYTSWFDSGSSYSDFYYNKNDKGLLLSVYEDDILITTIECGRIMVVNYLNKFIYGNTKKLYNIYFIIGRILGYHNCLILQSYNNFKSSDDNIDIFKTSNKYNFDLYDYFKNQKYILNNNEKYEYGLIKLNNLGEKIINNKLTNSQNMKLKDLFIDIVENRFEIYPKLEEYLTSLINLDNNYIFYSTNLHIFNYWLEKDIEISNYQEGYKLEDNYSVIFNRKRYRNLKLN